MSNRQNRGGRAIRGPQSALTDFLASQNISAAQIRATAEARRQAANGDDAQESPSARAADATLNTADNEDEGGEQEDADEDPVAAPTSARRKAQTQKRKKQAEAIDEIKKSKAKKKAKRDLDLSDSDIVNALHDGKRGPMPGQFANCEVCEKRFTVTPYTCAGPNGGLLCVKCAKDLAKDAPVEKKKKKSVGQGSNRRKVQSRILDGTYTVGAKSMMTLCIETLAKNIELASDLGEMPLVVVDKIARILAKRRLVTSQVLDLFLQPDAEVLRVYDGARLSSDDYIKIFQRLPKLKDIKLRNAIQFKDEVMKYLQSRNIELEGISLHGSNLLTEETWREYLEAKGGYLRSLQVYYTDKHFGDDMVASLSSLCPSLRRLKIYHNQMVSDKGVEAVASLEGLQHLGLDLRQVTRTEPYVKAISGIGKDLRTLSLRAVPDLDDRVLDAIHDHCRSLTKLRITESEVMTDSGFARLFTGWANKPLTMIDLQLCRHIDPEKPRENPHLVGLCSDGFRALMAHSGKSVKTLNIHSCRGISQEAFEDVFAADKEYPELQVLKISFCEHVNDFIVASIFRSCPNLREVNVFGCMKLKHVKVPRGRILVGMPNAIGMTIEGTED